MNYYLGALQKYADFDGRARRSEYWMFVLFNFIVGILLFIIGGLVHLPAIGLLYGLAVLLPSLAVTARRLHDTGRSAWWILIVFIPFIGAIILIVFAATDSQPGDNEYGPNPKAGGMPPAAPPMSGFTPAA